MPTELPERTRPVFGRRDRPGRSGPRVSWPRRPHGPGGRRPSDGEGAWSPGKPVAASTTTLGLGFALAAITMLFVAFTTTYLGHRQDGTWPAVPLPPVLWLDTGVLLASSAVLEWGRRSFRQGNLAGFRRDVTAAWGLGLAFLAGQLLAWRQLIQQGIYLSSNPHSSFFYLLTGAHGAHLLGGLVALGVILPRVWSEAAPPEGSTAINMAALYWHFLTGLWLYLFILLYWL